MNGSCPRRGRVVSSAALLAIALFESTAAAAEERQLPSWIPSIGLGFGLQSREIEGNIDGILATGFANPQPAATLNCQTLGLENPFLPPFAGRCDMSSSDARESDGAAFAMS